MKDIIVMMEKGTQGGSNALVELWRTDKSLREWPTISWTAFPYEFHEDKMCQ